MGELQSMANNDLRFEKISRFKTAKSIREGCNVTHLLIIDISRQGPQKSKYYKICQPPYNKVGKIKKEGRRLM